jgi:hypothetical protein
MRTFVLVMALAACGGGGDDGLEYDIDPGGDDTTGSSSRRDAAVEIEDGAATVSGRVCLAADSRAVTTCAPSGADGLTVSVGTSQATTASDGSFVIASPTGSNLVWRVTGNGIYPSAMRFSAAATTIPAIGTNLYSDMLAATDATVATGDGAIIARITDANVPVAGLVAASTPTSISGLYFDGSTSVDWQLDQQTGPFGAIWVPSIQTGTAALTIDNGTFTVPPTIANIPVLTDTITFVLYELP